MSNPGGGYDLLIRGGTVVTDGQRFVGDVAVGGGRIQALLGPENSAEATEIVDASGLIVMPGGIDAHFHTQTGGVYFSTRADDMQSATRSAAYGGITTVITFVWGDPGQKIVDYLGTFMELGTSLSVCDFSMHCGLRPEMETIQQVPEAFAMGVPTFKMHYDYRKTGQGRMSDDDHKMAAMQIIARNGGTIMFHCENGYVIDYLEDQFIAAGDTSYQAFLKSRPNLTEQEAVYRSIILSKLTGCPLYVVHLSTREGLQEIVKARASGVDVATETCPQYLTLTGDAMRDWGVLAKVGPPLRSQADVDAMWQGLALGQIAIVGSDHSAQTLEHKHSVGDDLIHAPFGTPIVETMLPLVFSEGVAKHRISLEQFVSAFTDGPAKRFGLYPRKGTLQPGADADIVLWDPNEEWTVTAEELHNPAGYTIYEGTRLRGRARRSWLRGRPLLADGRVDAPAGSGEFLARPSGVVR